MSQTTRNQKRFTNSEVGADWHELMIPLHIMRHPLSAPVNSWTRGAVSGHTTTLISHSKLSSNCLLARKQLLLIFLFR